MPEPESNGLTWDLYGGPGELYRAARALVLGRIDITTVRDARELELEPTQWPGWYWIPDETGLRNLIAVLDEEPERY